MKNRTDSNSKNNQLNRNKILLKITPIIIILCLVLVGCLSSESVIATETPTSIPTKVPTTVPSATIFVPTLTPTATITPTATPPYPVTGLFKVNECHEITICSPEGCYKFYVTLIKCVNSIEIHDDFSVRVYVSWNVKKFLGTTRSLKVVKFSDENNLNKYLTDNLGNRYDHNMVGGDASRAVQVRGGTLNGWYEFPPLHPGVSAVIFHDDDNKLQFEIPLQMK